MDEKRFAYNLNRLLNAPEIKKRIRAKDVAKQLGNTEGYVSNLRHNRTPFGPVTAERVAVILGVDIAEFDKPIPEGSKTDGPEVYDLKRKIERSEAERDSMLSQIAALKEVVAAQKETIKSLKRELDLTEDEDESLRRRVVNER